MRYRRRHFRSRAAVGQSSASAPDFSNKPCKTSADFVKRRFVLPILVTSDANGSFLTINPTMSEMESSQLPVLVVGAGPVGLVFALFMLRNAIPVRIIDKETSYQRGARGTGLAPRSEEALEFLGVLDDVLEKSTGPLQMATYGPDGYTAKIAEWSQSADSSPGIPYPKIASTSQASLEGVIRKHIEELGCTVETGVELTGLEQDEAGVTARLLLHAKDGQEDREEAFQCAYLVGADGARGRTRKLAGVSFLGETKEFERLLSANVYVTGANRKTWNMWGNFGTASIGLKLLLPEPLFQLQALGPNLPPVLPTDLEGIQQLFYNITNNRDIQFHKVECASEWRANIRMADAFSKGRVFLAGDAAHAHSPLGGQGTNSGIMDAMNLAWKLALVYHCRASSKLLTTYDEERMPVIAEMLSLTTALHAVAYGRNLPSSSSSTLQTGGNNIDMQGAMYRPKHLLQLGVNYRWSSAVVEGRLRGRQGTNGNVNGKSTGRNPYGQDSDHVRAGDRAPDAPGLVEISASGQKVDEPVRLFKLFDICRHTILVFPDNDGKVGGKDAHTSIQTLTNYARRDLASLLLVVSPKTAATLNLEGLEARVFVDRDESAARGYEVHDAALGGEELFVVVRPDGVVGAFAVSLEDVNRYFDNIVGV